MGRIDTSLLADGALVTIDTAPIIYILDGSKEFADDFISLFRQIEEGRIRAVISSITITEVLSGPLKHGNEILADRYFKSLTSGQGWSVQDVNAEIAFMAARIRIQYSLKIPDAIQIATAVFSGSSALVTHDRDFKGTREILILGL
ncbi:MAG: PIN domain-containing protein [Candidatus Marinimicrobia bacterium]|nr:PIN domain-containing protein [Candidatus Neomarinimicrobiota bacterium]MCH7764133.1 PIN domain-containing protein [Candidatus Neomarinimicrobiota bacterium]